MMRIAPLLVAAGLAGCSITYDPDVGALQPTSETTTDGGIASSLPAKCTDSDPDVSVSFSKQIRPLTTRKAGGCLFCHGDPPTSGLSVGSYESLRRGGQNSGTRIIVPGNPCESILPQKLGLAPPFGARMPYNGPPYFTNEELTLVRDWIAEGALDN
jgi:hypothetical protein